MVVGDVVFGGYVVALVVGEIVVVVVVVVVGGVSTNSLCYPVTGDILIHW